MVLVTGADLRLARFSVYRARLGAFALIDSDLRCASACACTNKDADLAGTETHVVPSLRVWPKSACVLTQKAPPIGRACAAQSYLQSGRNFSDSFSDYLNDPYFKGEIEEI